MEQVNELEIETSIFDNTNDENDSNNNNNNNQNDHYNVNTIENDENSSIINDMNENNNNNNESGDESVVTQISSSSSFIPLTSKMPPPLVVDLPEPVDYSKKYKKDKQQQKKPKITIPVPPESPKHYVTKKEKLILMDLSNEYAKQRVTTKNKIKKNQLKAVQSILNKRKLVRCSRNAWIAFLMYQKQLNHSTDALTSRTKTLAPIWKKMSDEEKRPYVEAHLKDKRRYKQDLEKLSKSERKFLKAQRKIKSKTYDSSVLKKPLSSYMLFASKTREEIKQEHPGIKIPQISNLLGQKWRSLSSEEREIYDNLYKTKKAEYDAKLKLLESQELKNMMLPKENRQVIDIKFNQVELEPKKKRKPKEKNNQKQKNTIIDSDDEEELKKEYQLHMAKKRKLDHNNKDINNNTTKCLNKNKIKDIEEDIEDDIDDTNNDNNDVYNKIIQHRKQMKKQKKESEDDQKEDYNKHEQNGTENEYETDHEQENNQKEDQNETDQEQEDIQNVIDSEQEGDDEDNE